MYLAVVQKAYNLVLRTPQGRKKLREQLAEARSELRQKLIGDKEGKVAALRRHTSLPQHGQSRQELLDYFDELEKISKTDWESGRVRWVQ
jgi:hypothetical protein